MRVMPIGAVSSTYALDNTSEVVDRLQSIMSIIGRARASGADSASMLLRSDNAVDSAVIGRLSTMYGDRLNIETNGGPSIRMTVTF